MELATGTGKTKLSIDLVNHLCDTQFQDKQPTMLLLVAKRVHKQTWQEEFDKWGGIKAKVTMECYESLKNHTGETFDFIVLDEVHHVKSEARLLMLGSLKFKYMIGLSATIPISLKKYLRYKFKSQFVSCDIIEAIEDDILPEPEILLFPLKLDNRNYTETWEINPKAKGPVVRGSYRDIWKYKKQKVHAILSCTQRQKLMELNSLIEWEKGLFMRTRSKGMEAIWLHHCGERLAFLASCKNTVVNNILKLLKNYRTITFCKTIEQAEQLGKNCIHSKNADADDTYNRFNSKKIKHITAVNILNENANLVDCKYAIFANLSSSDVIIPQRLGKL